MLTSFDINDELLEAVDALVAENRKYRKTLQWPSEAPPFQLDIDPKLLSSEGRELLVELKSTPNKIVGRSRSEVVLNILVSFLKENDLVEFGQLVRAPEEPAKISKRNLKAKY